MGLIDSDIPVITAYKSLNVKDAITFASIAWDEVTKTTIKNCWKASKLVDGEDNGDLEVNTRDISDVVTMAREVFQHSLKIEDLIEAHDSTEESTTKTDTEYLEEYHDQKDQLTVASQPSKSDYSVASKSISVAISVLKNDPKFSGNQLKGLYNALMHCNKRKTGKEQTNIEDFFVIKQ